MSLPKSMSHKNGQTPASSDLDEAALFMGHDAEQALSSDGLPDGLAQSAHAQTAPSPPSPNPSAGSPPSRTLFPTEIPKPSIRTIFYKLTHYYLAGATLFRWVVILVSILFLIALWTNPTYWIAGLVLWLGLTFNLLFLRRQFQKNDFVRFQEEAPPASQQPATSAALLDPAQKIPIHVTGLFAVEGREERFTWVTGFYRTFATREHALLCQVQADRFLGVASLDEEKVGMWYIFFQPAEVTEMHTGNLLFGSTPAPAIAITRQVERKTEGRFRRNKSIQEILYITFANDTDQQRVWADLQADRGA